jgi:cytochrome P450
MGLFDLTLTASLPLVVCLSLYIILQSLSCRKANLQEPPVVRLAVPYLGALMGMVTQGGKWLRNLAIRTKYPIFTIAMPGSRMYVVTSPALAAAVQRNKNLSFNPLIPMATQRILGLDQETVKIVQKNLNREDNIRGFIPELHDMVYAHMAPGESLDNLSASASKELANLVRNYTVKIHDSPDSRKEENLLAWCQSFVTIATARFLYGPKNPIDTDTDNEEAFWDFDHGLGFLLVNVMPSVTAPKAYRGRERLAKALEKYLRAGHHKSASPLIQQRVEISIKHGWKIDQLARAELSFLFAGIVNTAITSFWVILYIVARPHLLHEIRAEILAAFGSAMSGVAPQTVDAEKIRNECPIFMSIFRETLRVGSENSSTRIVMADTMLADQYFLKKDSVLQVVGGAMHVDQRIWGPDAGSFDPYRFMEENVKKRDKIHPAAYRAFGGGATLCPGISIFDLRPIRNQADQYLQGDTLLRTRSPAS